MYTTGCKANQWDTHVMTENLRKAGLSKGSLADADFIIINACTLTKGAERDIRRFINRTRRENVSARIILTGCHGQVFPDRPYGADLVLGHEEKFNIETFMNKTGVFRSDRNTFSLEEAEISSLQSGKTRFFLKIQDGCSNFCTYCVVPYARGIPRSRPVGEIVRIMKSLREKGVKEVVLTGIEISAYCDPDTGIGLTGLLDILERSETSPRIRMSSVDPLHIDDTFMKTMSESNKMMKSIHITLQSGSESVLKSMGRKYTPEFIKDVVEKLKDRIPDMGIGFDVISGFPGENEERFEETMQFLKPLDIYYLHVFPFSARPGTRAALMSDAVPDAEKKRRVRLLKDIDRSKRADFYTRFIGKRACIVPESKIYRGKYMRGYTDSYVPVYIPYKKGLENNLTEVTIKGMKHGLLVGSVNGIGRRA